MEMLPWLDSLKPLIPFAPLLAIIAIIISLASLVWNIVSRWLDNRTILLVQQTGGIENTVMSLDEFTVGVILNAVIVNNSPRTTVVVRYFVLELPWSDPEFDWLDDPAEMAPPQKEYAFRGTLEYKRELVLNHRRYDQGKLAPGESMRGLLMGRGLKPIPKDFLNGETVDMNLLIIDTTGKKYSGRFKARISRTYEQMRRG